MIEKTLLFVGLFVYAQLASGFLVQHPYGFVDVQQTGHGFNVIDMRTHEITSVMETGSGYVVTPQGEPSTFIMMQPGDDREEIENGVILPSVLDDDM